MSEEEEKQALLQDHQVPLPPPQHTEYPPEYPPPQGTGYPPPQDTGYGPPPPPPAAPYQSPPPSGPPYQPPLSSAGYQAAPYQVNVRPSPVVPNVIFGSTPLQICCPNCQAIVITDTQYVYGTMVWLSVLILFLLGFWCFFWIPLVINDLKDVHHYCPTCKHRCGVYSRL